MNEKMKSILDHLIQGTAPPTCNGMPLITGYEEVNDGSFIVLETDLPDDKLQIHLSYDAGDPAHFDSALRIEVMLIFGFLDINVSTQTAANQLLRMLAEHNESEMTTSFVGILPDQSGNHLVTLNSVLQLLMGWEDSEIAIVLSTCLTNLVMASAQRDPSLTMLSSFWQ